MSVEVECTVSVAAVSATSALYFKVCGVVWCDVLLGDSAIFLKK